jgi:hypothetical protein
VEEKDGRDFQLLMERKVPGWKRNYDVEVPTLIRQGVGAAGKAKSRSLDYVPRPRDFARDDSPD